MTDIIPRIAIIGTAGRGEDGKKMNEEIYMRMINKSEELITKKFKFQWRDIVLVSGGAAWSDHVAVDLSLKHRCKLELYFPCYWDYENNRFNTDSKEGKTSNYYHNQFSKKTNKESLNEIGEILKKGASMTIGKGFFDRNLMVGKVNHLIAFTWGKGEAPKKGGTFNTWKNSIANIKIHVNLENLVNKHSHSITHHMKGINLSKNDNESPYQQFLNNIDDNIFDLLEEPNLEKKTKKRKILLDKDEK